MGWRAWDWGQQQVGPHSTACTVCTRDAMGKGGGEGGLKEMAGCMWIGLVRERGGAVSLF